MDCHAPAGLAVSDLFGAGIFIEIARSEATRQSTVTLPHSLALIVRTQFVDAVNGLPRPCGIAVSDLFGAGIFIEIARSEATRQSTVSLPRMFSPDR